MQLRDGALGCRVNFSRSNWSVSWAKRKAFAGYSVLVWIANWKGFTWASAKLTQTVPNLETCILLNGTLGATLSGLFGETALLHRFSAFWLRSKCSICSYQLNIWYEDHVSSSILVWFLPGDGLSGACSGSVKSWPCIAVSQGLAHFPTCDHHYIQFDSLQFHSVPFHPFVKLLVDEKSEKIFSQ